MGLSAHEAAREQSIQIAPVLAAHISHDAHVRIVNTVRDGRVVSVAVPLRVDRQPLDTRTFDANGTNESWTRYFEQLGMPEGMKALVFVHHDGSFTWMVEAYGQGAL